MRAGELKLALCRWANRRGISLPKHPARAEIINFDYRGWRFGNIFLAGDAAGVASGLTGEGIFPAIVSGEAVAGAILNPDGESLEMNQLIRNHSYHRRLNLVTGRSRLLSAIAAESAALALRCGLLDFKKLEMAH